MIRANYQLVVIGAGPAGMAAAISAAAQGVEVAVVDEQPAPGGQIYRSAEDSPLRGRGILGSEYRAGDSLLRAFRNARVDYLPGASVWYLDRDRRLGVTRGDRGYRIDADRVVLATGAQERPMPFTGWHLPGVITAGAAQILLKSAALVPRQAPLLAGSGPLLLLLAVQLLRAGVGVGAILDTTPAGRNRRALRHLPRALAGADYLYRGWQMLSAIRRARVPYYYAVRNLHASGDGRLQRVGFEVNAKRQELAAELLLLHQGVVPAMQLAESAGCAVRWNDAQISHVEGLPLAAGNHNPGRAQLPAGSPCPGAR